LNFIDELSLSKFWYQFNGHIFVNTKGKENRATVEYAPFQKIPKSKRKLDSRENTIGEDDDFKKFLEKLKEPQINLPSAEEQLDTRLAKEKELVAASGGIKEEPLPPLLQFILEKKAQKIDKKRSKERKEKEEIKLKDVTSKKKIEYRRRKKKDDEKDSIKKEMKNEDKTDKSPKEEVKRGNNGVWMVRKNVEPGSVSILPKDKISKNSSQNLNPSSTMSSHTSITIPPNGVPNPSLSDRKSRSDRHRTEIKIYAPKHRQEAGQAIKIPGNQVSIQVNKTISFFSFTPWLLQ